MLYASLSKEEFDLAAGNRALQQTRYEEIKDELKTNEIDHAEMNKNHASLMRRVEDVNQALDDKIDDKV